MVNLLIRANNIDHDWVSIVISIQYLLVVVYIIVVYLLEIIILMSLYLVARQQVMNGKDHYFG